MDRVNQAKSDALLGKEWYAISDQKQSDGLLNFIHAKATELYPELMKSHPSVPGIFWNIYNRNRAVFRHVEPFGIYVIHKKGFKRYLKKAIAKSYVPQ